MEYDSAEKGAPTDASSLWVRRRPFLLAFAALYLAAGAAVYLLVDRATLDRALTLPLSLIAGLLGLSLVNYVLRAWRWIVLSGYLRVPIRPARNALYYLAGYALTSTPGKAGEAIRLWFLKTGHGVPYARSIPIMLADRVLDAWAVLILVLICVADFSAHLLQGLAALAVIAAVSAPIVFPRLFEPVLGWALRRMPGRQRLVAKLRRVMHSMDDLSGWRTYGLTLLPSVAGWAAEGAALYLLLRYFGAEVSVANAVFVFSFSAIVGAVSMLPGGLGSTEVSAVLLLGALGVDLNAAIVSIAIIRVTTLWFAIAIGAALLPSAIGAATRAGRGMGAP